jgi:hypothetical protein
MLIVHPATFNGKVPWADVSILFNRRMSLCGSSIELNNIANIAIITIHSTAKVNRAKKNNKDLIT